LEESACVDITRCLTEGQFRLRSLASESESPQSMSGGNTEEPDKLPDAEVDRKGMAVELVHFESTTIARNGGVRVEGQR
jgi:hypothetical protein